jgi:predicted porin
MEIYRMKKSLLAVAALSAIAGVAQAQSSVTIYGVLDVGYLNDKSTGSGTSATTNATSSQIGQSMEQSSRLGFKGTEDLGGGTSALFTVETGLQASNTTVSTWNNRQSFVGLKKNGLGQFAIGTQYTPGFQALSATDVGQTNNMPGSAVYPINPNTGGNSGAAPFAGPAGSAGSGTSDGITVRTSNMLTVNSDNFAGFTLGASYTQNGSTTTPTNTIATTNNYTGWGVKLDYTWNKLYVVGAMNKLKSSNTSPSVTSVATSSPAIWNTASGGNNTQDNQAYAAATYDFGILKAYLQYINRKDTSTVDTNYYAQRRAQQIGVRSYITPTIEGWANVGNGKVTTFGNSAPSANFTAWQTGLNYYLSKRTNLYGIYGANNLSSSTASSGLALNNTGFALGVRHTF